MGGHSQGQPVLTGAGESGLPRPRRAKWRDCRELPALEAMPTTATARQIAAQRTQAPMASEGLRGPPNPWRRVASFSGMAKQQHTGAVPEPGSCPGSQFHRTGLQSYLKNFFQCQRPKKAWKFVVGIQSLYAKALLQFFFKVHRRNTENKTHVGERMFSGSFNYHHGFSQYANIAAKNISEYHQIIGKKHQWWGRQSRNA